MSKKEEFKIPIYHKLNLTIEEAAAYSNIGEKRIREEANNLSCKFAITIGEKKILIKRKEFEEWNSEKRFL